MKKKHDFIEGPVSHEHIKVSALYQVYCFNKHGIGIFLIEMFAQLAKFGIRFASGLVVFFAKHRRFIF